MSSEWPRPTAFSSQQQQQHSFRPPFSVDSSTLFHTSVYMILILHRTHAGVNFPLRPLDPRPTPRHYLYLYVYNRSRYLYGLFACVGTYRSIKRCFFYEQPMDATEESMFSATFPAYRPKPKRNYSILFLILLYFQTQNQRGEERTCGHLTRQGFCFSRSEPWPVRFPDRHTTRPFSHFMTRFLSSFSFFYFIFFPSYLAVVNLCVSLSFLF